MFLFVSVCFGIGATIRTHQEIQRLLYSGFFFNTEFEMLRNFIHCSNMLEAEVDSVPTLFINYSRNPKKVENQEEASGKFPDFGEI